MTFVYIKEDTFKLVDSDNTLHDKVDNIINSITESKRDMFLDKVDIVLFNQIAPRVIVDAFINDNNTPKLIKGKGISIHVILDSLCIITLSTMVDEAKGILYSMTYA